MWCVAETVSTVLGQSREWVWLEILADRHVRGRRLTNIPGRISAPHGGLHAAEAIAVLERYSYRLVDQWAGTRRLDPGTTIDLCRRWADIWPSTKWVILQASHLAMFDGATLRHTLVLDPKLRVAKIWRVEPQRRRPSLRPEYVARDVSLALPSRTAR